MQISIKIGIWLQKLKFCKGKEIQKKYDQSESVVGTTYFLKVQRESRKRNLILKQIF